jgi:hypothetical protein
VKASIRQKLLRSKRRIHRRLDKHVIRGCERPMFTARNIQYEIADRTRAISAGGIGMIHRLVQHLQLPEAIDRELHLLKWHLPYHESDHVFNIAYNLLAGGECLEHLELRRNDEVYLDALGARRIPDPTTAGDFCRRFQRFDVLLLMEVFNHTRLRVWKQQDASFFRQAILDADGTMVETCGECKQGAEFNYQKQWGYHPLVISLANTGEPLYIVNRPGNRPSHEDAHLYLDLAIDHCRAAGFRGILLRGDTDFSQTAHLDHWHEDGVEFVFGIDAMPNLYEIAENLPPEAWKPLAPKSRPQPKTGPRARPPNVKQQVVEQREYRDVRLAREWVAEFDYRPAACEHTFRMVVVWKDLEEYQGQKKLFDDTRCFFYITNVRRLSAEAVVQVAHDRANQENHIQQLKHGVPALTAPLDNLVSNGAYMVMAALAWSLKAWAALLLGEHPRCREKHRQEKQALLRMDFATFRGCCINMPAQIIRTGRRTIFRLLSWNPWQNAFFRLLDQLSLPMRC